MAGNYTRRINLYINGKEVRNDIKSISAEMTRLTRIQRTMTIGSKEYNQSMARIKYLKKIIAEHNASLNTTKANLLSIKGLANAFNKYWPVIMGTIGTIAGLSMRTKASVDQFTEFDDKLADVMKVTNMTRSEVVKLNAELMKIDTRTAQNDLLDLAYVAGKLGITGEKNLLGFVNAADKISVALRKELGGNAEAAVRAIGKSVEIFDLDKVYGIEEAMLRLGSAVNALGMASTAQEGFLINFVERTAGIAPLAGVSVQNILGLAAALDKYGQKAEVSATAYSKLMSKMATETESMAKVMGMSIEDYVTAFTEDANETMLRLFETLKGQEGNATFAELVNLLGETDLEGQRMTQIMGTMVNKVDEIRHQMELSNKAFAENTSIINEFNIKNETAAAKVEKKQKAIKALRVEMGERLLPVYMQGLNMQARLIKLTAIFIEFLYKYGHTIISLITYLVIYKTTLAAITAIQKTNIIVSGVARAITLKLSQAYFLLTGQMYKAAKAQVLLNKIAIKNPWVLFASAVIGVVAAIVAYNVKVKEAIKQTLSLNDEFQRIYKEKNEELQKEKIAINFLVQSILEYNSNSALRNELLKELQENYPDFLGNLDAETASNNELAAQLRIVNDSYIEKAKLMALAARSEALQQQIVKNELRKYEIFQELSKPPEKLYTPGSDEEKDFLKNKNKLSEEYDFLTLSNKNLDAQLIELNKKEVQVNETAYHNTVKFWQDKIKELEFDTKTIWNNITIAKNNDVPGDVIEKSISIYDEKVEELLVAKKQLELLLAKIKKAGMTVNPDGTVSKNTKADYSEDAEARARTNAKNKYLKGIIKTEIDLNNELDRIALSFMRGRLGQMDKDAEDRAKLLESIADKELEIQGKKNKMLEELQATGAELSPLQKEELDFINEVKKLNLQFVAKKDMTSTQLLAMEALEKKHQQNINKIDAEAMKDNIEQRQTNFEVQLSKVQQQHIDELDAITTYEDAMIFLRQHYSDEELKNITKLGQAKVKIQKWQQEQEEELAINHINELLTILNGLMITGEWEGVKLADSIMSPEEWAFLKTMLTELTEKLRKLKKEKTEPNGQAPKEDENDIKLRGQFKSDILGFTVSDWKQLFDNLKKGDDLIGSLTMAAYALGTAWGQVNKLISNAEQKELARYETQIEKRKLLLDQQFDDGLISQEFYNKKVEELDKKLDYKKAVFARNQAIRDRNNAIFQAIINTASGIAEALPNIALSIIVGAAGALQVATIASTPLPELPGLEKGGFINILRQQDNKKFNAKIHPNQRGFIDKPTVITGEKPNSREYVVPDIALDNPTIRPFIETIEMARINHRLSSINMNALMPSLSGRQNGGFISQTPKNSTHNQGNAPDKADNNQPHQSDPELIALISRLNKTLENGVYGKWVLKDLEDLTAKRNKVEAEANM